MSQHANTTRPTSSTQHHVSRRRVTRTDHGDVLIRIPAGLIDLFVAVAALLVLASIPFVAAVVQPLAIGLPFGVLVGGALLATPVLAPLAAVLLLSRLVS